MRGAAARLDLTRVRRFRFAEKVCKACPVSFKDNETARTLPSLPDAQRCRTAVDLVLPMTLFSISGLLSDSDPPPREAPISLSAKAGLLRQDETKTDGRGISATLQLLHWQASSTIFGSISRARPTVEPSSDNLIPCPGDSWVLTRAFGR